MLLFCTGPAYYRMCSTDVYCSKQTGSDGGKENHHLSLSSFLELGGKKTVDTYKICGGAENVVKQKASKHS